MQWERYRVIGPWDESELQVEKQNCARRGVLVLQCVLEDKQRLGGPSVSRCERELVDVGYADFSALLLAFFMDHGLPERFRLSADDILIAIMFHGRRTKRELLKQAYTAWRSIGCLKPRGWILPPFQKNAFHARTGRSRDVQSL